MIFAIVGCAPCYREDLYDLSQVVGKFKTVAINNQAFNLRTADIWVFLDHDCFYERIQSAREYNGKPMRVVSPRMANGVDHKWTGDKYATHGGTAMYAMKYVLNHLGGSAVLCGCPMDNSGYYDGRKGAHGEIVLPRLRDGLHTLDMGKIRSMSGNTADIFGRPDEEWVDDNR